MTEPAQLEFLREELADQMLICKVQERMVERTQAIEIDIDTMSIIGLVGAREETPR